LAVAFSDPHGRRNIIAAEQLEALIDGMGAATVSDRRLFDAPRGKFVKERYNFDDSCIYGLLVGRFPPWNPSIDALVRFDTST
jgi:hypothetical protein